MARIKPRTAKQVPTILALGSNNEVVVGDPARDAGLQGNRTIDNFKLQLGEFQNEEQYQSRLGKRGQKLSPKVRPLRLFRKDGSEPKSLTYLEAGEKLLEEILGKGGGDDKPQKFVVGVPPLDGEFQKHYKDNLTYIFNKLGYDAPAFLWEPFAVFQYYRHIDKKIKDTGDEQAVMVIDFGGGTFDCCVVRTTKKGELSQGGFRSRPLGFKSCSDGGSTIDAALLALLVEKAKETGVVFKEDPVERSQTSEGRWLVEDGKISLSKMINNNQELQNDHLGQQEQEKILKSLTYKFDFPVGTLHQTEQVVIELNGVDLKTIIRDSWDSTWANTVIKCHQESEKQDKAIDYYDAVVVGGGSAQLPFLTGHIKRTLPGVFQNSEIVIGDGQGGEVAYGLAVEAEQQTKRHPGLAHERMFRWLESDIYIQLAGEKAHLPASPKVTNSNSVEDNPMGRVYGALTDLKLGSEDRKVTAQLTLKHSVSETLYYNFFDLWGTANPPLNVEGQWLKVPKTTRWRKGKKINLELDISVDGQVTPNFIFARAGQERARVAGQPFSLDTVPTEGKAFIGVDFGSSNTYITEWHVPKAPDSKEFQYPIYTVDDRGTLARLRSLEERFRELKKQGRVTEEIVLEHAMAKRHYFVFHNNKIEGGQLTSGQTKTAIEESLDKDASKDEIEAKNLAEAYDWILDIPDAYLGSKDGAEGIDGSQLSFFLRDVNRMLRRNANEKNETDDMIGAFRHEPAWTTLKDGSRHDYPPSHSINPFVDQLGKEISDEKDQTSGLELAVRAHTTFVQIHPFRDGNGRTARLLMTAILVSHGLPIIDLKPDDRSRYLDALEQSNKGKLGPMLNLFADLMEVSIAECQEYNLAVTQKDAAAGNIADNVIEINPVSDQLNSETNRDRDPDSTERVNQGTGVRQKGSNAFLAAVKAAQSSKKVAGNQVSQRSQDYRSWAHSFQAWKSEVEALIGRWDKDIDDTEVSILFATYDELSEEGYVSLCRKHTESPRLINTWFAAATLHQGHNYYRVMFRFGGVSDELRKVRPRVADVSCSLAIGGAETGQWRALRDEPITLREIGYEPSRMVYFNAAGEVMEDSQEEIIEKLMLEMFNLLPTGRRETIQSVISDG